MKKTKILILSPLVLFLTSCDINITAEDFTSKLIPNWPSFVAQLGALIVLILVVIIFAYKPVKKIIEKRQEYIESNIKESEKSKAVWQENELKSKELVIASNKEAEKIVADAKAKANEERQAILDQTAEDVRRMKDTASEDIARMELEAQESIRKEMVDVALEASSELLGREVNSKDNERLLKEFIEDIKK